MAFDLADYFAVCAKCGLRIDPPDAVSFIRSNGGIFAQHPACEDQAPDRKENLMTTTVENPATGPETSPESRVHARVPDVSVPTHTVCARDLIFPSPLNPRKHFDGAELESLAESIRQHGVLQPILLRPQAGDRICLRYDIVLGERRWRAAEIAGLVNIPVIIREDIDDKLHLKLAMEENIRRDDLTTMEMARGFRAMMDAGWTQAEIGKDLGRGKQSISNTVRLLDLPDDVQAMIDDGRLTPAHGVALCRYKDFPELASHLAAEAVKDGWTSKDLEAGLTWKVTSEAKRKGLVVDLGGYDTRAAFDWRQVCKKDCPFAAFRGASDQRDGGYCLRPAHFQDLQKEGVAKREAASRSEAERLRQRALAQAEQAKKTTTGPTPAGNGTTSKNLSHATADIARAEKSAEALKGGLPTLRSLGSHVVLRGDAPAGCSENCACRIKAQDYGEQTVDVCLDPGRLNAMKAATTRQEQKDRKARFDLLRKQIAEEVLTAPPGRGLAMLVYEGLCSTANGGTEAKREIAETLPDGPLKSLLGETGYSAGRDVSAWQTLAALPLSDMDALATRFLLLRELHERYSYKSDAIPKTEWWLGRQGVSSNRVEICQGSNRGQQGIAVRYSPTNVEVLLDGEASTSYWDPAYVRSLQNDEPGTGRAPSGDPTADCPATGGRCTKCCHTEEACALQGDEESPLEWQCDRCRDAPTQ